ncbi:hypothetical protein [Novosphingobium sp. Fuku2-ISO-50]|uniref:hypothetical protein n=1 Tax=Novosphingobium sp. Fuku2-ISO-50 TaxID=1739114 RepID=UPI00076CE656|nr:hypothetical protein [Novosphingobium sp. Fuku2-ISO-50]KUR74429.1 hypothetical protein AQZ50_17925 [Novosphingobium sp. Fuku2-ISO-50]
MHTERNRQARKTRKGAGPSQTRSTRDDGAFLLKPGAPPRFPVDLIVPPHRGPVITAAPWPLSALPLPSAPQPADLQTAGRKAARKAERRAAALARAEAVVPPATEALILVAAPKVDAPVPETIGPEAPLPASRALVPRRHGFVDAIAFVLRDSGRRLARWSSARRRAEEMKEKLARAEARMRAMEAQLAALQALQERVRQAS